MKRKPISKFFSSQIFLVLIAMLSPYPAAPSRTFAIKTAVRCAAGADQALDLGGGAASRSRNIVFLLVVCITRAASAAEG